MILVIDCVTMSPLTEYKNVILKQYTQEHKKYKQKYYAAWKGENIYK